ncbi:MAG: ribose ABC transporter permease [Oscillospiraceae bacterium]|nr:ribose ABC transporter permease [Oscillospiraceae bacterium]
MTGNREKLVDMLKTMGAIFFLILLVTVLSIMMPQFRTLNNAMIVLRQASVTGFVAFGMTCVILTGGIDLSVGSVLALTAVIGAMMLDAGVNEIIAIFGTLAAGLALGSLNGFTVTKLRLQPFIATLIGMSVYRGLALILTGGRSIANLTGFYVLEAIGRGDFLGIPVPIWLMLVVFGLFFFLLHKTALGRRIYAVGSNATAAQLAGVSITKTKMFVYAVSGLMASVSALILVSRLRSAQPVMGVGLELDAIAAVALGGTSMAGGRGKIYGTLAGVLIISVLSNGMNIMGVPSYYQTVVTGIVILLAVLADPNR